MKKKNKSILDDNRLVFLLSLLIAAMAWIVATTAIDPNTTVTKRSVPVVINVEDSPLIKLGLNVIKEKDEYVDVEIKGERLIVGNITTEDIVIEAQLSGITAPGVYSVNLVGKDKFGKGFEVTDIKPRTIQLKLDRLTTKKFPVEIDFKGLEIPEGYYLEDETVTPREIIITGPEVDIERVHKAVLPLEINRALTKTETFKSKIELRDKEGNIVDGTHINIDHTSAEVTFPVLKIKEIPVSISFLNAPPNFPTDELEYTFSNETITIAGPENRVDSYTEINLGYVDIKNLNKDSIFAYEVKLPSDFVNIENIETIVVEFDMKELESKKFNVDNIKVVNTPVNYDITVSTKQLLGVNMIGDKEIIETMSASDIVAEIDISDREITTGQIRVPVTVYAPSKGLVWANGSYQAIVVIKEKN